MLPASVTALLLVLSVAGITDCAGPASSQTKHVVLFVIDDMRWDSLGAAGNNAIHTPRLDRLASEGVRFSQAFVTTSVCWVSRASILTGQYMSRHGITGVGAGRRELSPALFAQTFPHILRKQGFWTGFVGKWNLGRARETDWDFLRVYEGQHWLKRSDGIDRIHVTEQNLVDSLEFLRQRPKNKPFFLDLSFFAAHAVDQSKEQYMPQDWSASFYKGKVIPPPLHGDDKYRRALPSFLSNEINEGRIRYHWRFGSPLSYQATMTNYYRLLTEVDAAIGRVVDELKAQKVYDQTLIIVVGDNGYFQADRGLADKWYPYEESIRVPLLIRDPRMSPDRRGIASDKMALNIDIAPTILRAVSAPLPDRVQGQDLAQTYLYPGAAWRDEFFYEHPSVLGKERIPASLAVIRRDWKYVVWPD